MIRLNDETRKALIALAKETQVFPEGNFVKLLDPGDDAEFREYIEKSLARDRNMRQRRLEITKQIQIQNRDLTRYNEQVTILNQDLTIALEEQKKAKEQVILALKRLEKKNRDLAQFSWMTSHNLRGPLASTLGIINLIRDFMQQSADLQGLYEHLRSSAVKMDEVLQDVSMLLETRDSPPILNEELQLQPVLQDCMGKLRELSADIGDFISGDFAACPSLISTRVYLEGILHHLLSNAYQYRSVERTAIITVSSMKEDDFAVITVADNGDGIKAEDLERIFEPFKKLHYSSTGKGLGLYLARTQAEALGGSITVTSEVGVGSRFIVRLPLNGIESEF